jgi:heptosyltransferase-2
MAHYFNGIARYLGCEKVPQIPILQTVPDDDAAIETFFAHHNLSGARPVVVINPGASYGVAKCWIPDRFAEVADGLIEKQSASVIIVCGPGEVEIAQRIRQSMQNTAIVCDDPILPLGQMAALFKRTDLLVTNDTGARPMAMAFGVPIVTIFGSTDPAWTEVNYPRERKVSIPVDCGPCMKRVCPLDHRCMTGISSQMVLDAADDLLSEPASERAIV